MRAEKRHWKIVNVFGRVFGLMCLIFGVIAAADGIILLRNPHTFDAEPIGQTLTGSFMWDLFGIFPIALLIGVLFMAVKPYRPDLYEPNETKVKAQRRSWWTGEPRREAYRE